MAQHWQPSQLSRLIAVSPQWNLTLGAHGWIIEFKGRKQPAISESDINLTIKNGLIWSRIVINKKAGEMQVLPGLPKTSAKKLQKILEQRERDRQRVQLIKEIRELLDPVLKWYKKYCRTIHSHNIKQRWVTEETIHRISSERPSTKPRQYDLAKSLAYDANIREYMEPKLLEHAQKAVRVCNSNIRSRVEDRNAKFMEAEIIRQRPFLESIAARPLTDEQSRAVVCFDNRVQTIASAGSGKTATLIAKVGYAIHRNLIDSRRILLLAFNRSVRDELKQRLKRTLSQANLNSDGVQVKTFHEFGLQVIGEATGRKPSVPKDISDDGGTRRLAEIVDGLKDSDRCFRTKWDFFRMVLSRHLPGINMEAVDPEDWDSDTKRRGFRTLNGEIVKSQSERLIADWLFYNGVKYQYEPAYEYDTVDAHHQQYRPDFYYPDAELYHEHFALDSNGNPPDAFEGYLEGVKWKRNIHARYETQLLETTSAELWSGHAFDKLEVALSGRGVNLDPNPDRPVPGRAPIESEGLARLFRSFLTHAKNNQLSQKTLRERQIAESFSTFRYRHRLFLDLFFPIRDRWEKSLDDEGKIDFEDMLGDAAEHIQSGRWHSPYQLILVDEFQDASQARARLVSGLLAAPDRYLFAVGDDWQSIYRFAGSDISIMTQFEERYGRSQKLRLQKTFRCPQWLCDLSTAFVMKNPAQLSKEVIAERQDEKPAIRAIQARSDGYLVSAIDNQLSRLYEGAASGRAANPQSPMVTVYILGRYRADQQLVPKNARKRYSDRLIISFATMHGVKGLEADHVIVPRLKRGSWGFPCNIEDDPVLHLAMPPDDHVANAEERRLFYVALTRAKASITLFTIARQPSPFLVELINDGYLERIEDPNGERSAVTICPRCEKGILVERNSRYGRFYGCDQFPKCKYKSPI